jgi:hypothetical protein
MTGLRRIRAAGLEVLSEGVFSGVDDWEEDFTMRRRGFVLRGGGFAAARG